MAKHDDGPDALEVAVATSAAPSSHWSSSDAFTDEVRYDGRFVGPPPQEYYRDLTRQRAAGK